MGQVVELVGRRFNPHSSSSLTEIVTCRGGEGADIEVLIKYGGANDGHTNGPHRGGTQREALVYERVLGSQGIRPRYYGRGIEQTTGRTWIALEYISGALRLNKGPQPQSLLRGARWLGDFHAKGENQIRRPELDFLPVYNQRYYTSWVSRTAMFARDTVKQCSWFTEACERSTEAFGLLVDSPHTTVHGEFYPKNILCHNGSVTPVDWESAAVAPAEIDLASLLEGWGADYSAKAVSEYCAARGLEPDDRQFGRRLSAARVYWRFRWLGASPEWVIPPNGLQRLCDAVREFVQFPGISVASSAETQAADIGRPVLDRAAALSRGNPNG